jgi:xylan 1,4-beta-xylosidase
VVEGFALEAPKLLKHGGWIYMFSAQGGTAGPPTSHMVVAARSRSVRGPWENCPHNPIVRTVSQNERWWSRGHATPIEGPTGDWWLVYHGYENGFRALGRQMLLEPFEWTADGWPRALGSDLSQPIRKPRGGKPGPHKLASLDTTSAGHLASVSHCSGLPPITRIGCAAREAACRSPPQAPSQGTLLR